MNRTEFAQLAARQTKPKKAEAAQLIRDMAAMRECDADRLPECLAKLYRYFLPTPNAKQRAADPFAWVASAAIRPGGTRPQLEHVHANGVHIVATDGHRLHAVPDPRAPGLYDPVTGVKTHDLWQDAKGAAANVHPGNFPNNWEDLLERGATQTPIPLSEVVREPVTVGGTKAYLLQHPAFDPTPTVDVKQWDALTCAAGPSAHVRQSVAGAHSDSTLVLSLDAFSGARAVVLALSERFVARHR